MPVASDLPPIAAVMVEIPNPNHPHGVKGVGEIPLVPSLAAIANAIAHATGKRLYELPMSPPKVLEALSELHRLYEVMFYRSRTKQPEKHGLT